MKRLFERKCNESKILNIDIIEGIYAPEQKLTCIPVKGIYEIDYNGGEARCIPVLERTDLGGDTV